MKNNPKVLIIKHGSLGDIFMALDAINSIQKHFNSNNIYFCTTKFGKKTLLELDLGFNLKFIVDDRKKNPILLFFLLYKLITHNFDYIIDLQNSKRTCFYIYFLRFFKKKYINSTCRFANYRFIPPIHGTQHVKIGLEKQLEILNIKKKKIYFGETKINKNKIALIVPGSSATGILKRWPLEKYNELMKKLIGVGYTCYVIGGEEDLELKQMLLKDEKIVDLIKNSPWKKVIELSLSSSLAISNDTSNMHLISNLGCPTIAIMKDGPLTISNSPYNELSFTFVNKNIKNINVENVFLKAIEIAR